MDNRRRPSGPKDVEAGVVTTSCEHRTVPLAAADPGLPPTTGGRFVDIRPWSESDTDWWVALRLAWQPGFGEGQLRLLAAGQVATFTHRGVAWAGGQRVGYTHVAYPPGQDQATAQVLVSVEHRGRGLGSALFANTLAHGPAGPLMTAMPDDDDRSLAVAQHWGFTTVSHAIRSRLDLAAHPSVREDTPGYTIRIVDSASPASVRERLDLLVQGSDTSPEANDLGWRSTVADFEQMFPGVVWVVVELQGTAVAVASASPKDGGDWLVIYTGVLPEHRRKGLARMAKLRLHTEAAERGARTLTTDNEERNVGVRGLNQSLGYERVGGEIRSIRPASEPARG
jgi:GNAT superfamily N-acetyltransferase